MSGPIRLPVGIKVVLATGEKFWQLLDANDEKIGLGIAGSWEEMNQLCAALNATAPGQAAEGQPVDDLAPTGLSDRDAHIEVNRLRAKLRANAGKSRPDRVVPQPPPRYDAVYVEGVAQLTEANEPAGEQRRCLTCGSATCEGTHMVRERDYSAVQAHMAKVWAATDPQPAETTTSPLRSQLESHLATPPEERPELVVDAARDANEEHWESVRDRRRIEAESNEGWAYINRELDLLRTLESHVEDHKRGDCCSSILDQLDALRAVKP